MWTTDRQFCATVSDPGGGNVTAFFIIGGTTYTGTTVASSSASCYTHTADVNAVVSVYAKDANGATSSNAYVTAYIDAAAPTFTFADTT